MRCEDFPCCGHELGCCPNYDEEGDEILEQQELDDYEQADEHFGYVDQEGDWREDSDF